LFPERAANFHSVLSGENLTITITIFCIAVAKTQDVRLDGTIFFGNTGQKDRATFMNKNIPIEYPKLVETYRNPVLRHRLTMKTHI